jgi:predicted DNA-binding protein (UPF0251 family)
MPRPIKWRRVQFKPESTYFIPVDKKNCLLENVTLKIEEVEAMRLKDIEKLNQEQCAEKMMVSRQTFQNIIESARKKVTIALVEGKAIKINGGNFTYNICSMKCLDCDYVFDMNYETNEIECPNCKSEEIRCSKKQGFCQKKCSKSSSK